MVNKVKAANGAEILRPRDWEYRGLGMSPRLAELLEFYLCSRVPSSDFLHAVLSNDLREAYELAPKQREMLHVYVAYLVRWAPEEAWGSPIRVRAWLAQRPQQEPCECWEGVNDREGKQPCEHERLPAGGGPFNNSSSPGKCRCGANGPPWKHAKNCQYD